MASEHIEQKLALLPDLPGSYQMKDVNGKIIYVGKAKNLKNRVRSYFKSEHTGKTAQLVENIADFDFIVTSSEKESLLLEITLIQKYQPYYNIRLKRGTGYPYIKITHESDPKLELANDVKEDGAQYFGPYPNVYAAQETLHFLQKVYPLRRCNGYQGRPCLYANMGQCLGPCYRKVPFTEYLDQIKKIQRFLDGDTREVTKVLQGKMADAAEKLEFERAADLRDQLKFIETTVEKQKIISKDGTPRDLFNFYMDKGWLSVQVFFIRQARLMKREKRTFAIVDSPEEELTSFILQFYNRKNAVLPKEILVPAGVDKQIISEVLNVPVRTPQRGEKRDLLDLAEKNAKIVLDEKFRLMEMNESKTNGAMQEIADALGLDHIHRIEAFDHSHTQGEEMVSAMVVFEDGVPNKNKYRKYKTKTVDHADERAETMEVIRRRYTRLLKEHAEMPDLILMDGGVIQLNAAREVIEDELGLAIPVAAMVKNDQHKTADLLREEGEPHVNLDPKSQGFFLLQRIQDEVHRFAITFHRQLRSKSSLGSKLDEIAGVGPKTRQKLLTKFGSLKKIANASIEELREVGVSEKVANAIKISLQAIQHSDD
ncbi:excinuclease ABC subunit UvrC [Weissella confusa]|uniref:UvrABC system protein C n=1 Tax=Weissella confusa TaxID=1583 RepID=A0A4Z0RNK1_WEICO|nr:excinuclease ABC subunit UvrC [Weissella confusa]MBJ7631773.1 excinuclease ABC subunit UvrC [Weissella confusa]MBJ7637819.1 excinuclease ABC subunit UvrC [Weissella confusa]MBJ7644546.1 excinuclease ABC subunit UvrC [Weissella confusa]MBJ7669296.1 excinuclease ABC subunit UvrC [Weissella confusa]MBJ7673194.1 excinuclease ABC subunit UvrC [Weissella confusa]